MALEKEQIPEKISEAASGLTAQLERRIQVKYQGVVVGHSPFHLEGLLWESVFHPWLA
ncbi:MAG TPA: hypothetical protein VEO53_07825 [Candidatus Binatia bacterium]|nr:hypothetical protein [Candidatus Binatia bacterium]